MMKLVVDLRLIHNSGIGTYIKNVIPSIIKDFDEVLVLGDPMIIKKFDWHNQVKIIPFTYKVYTPIEQLMYIFKIPKCDVFWTPHFNTPLFFVRTKRRLVTIHDVNHLANPSHFSLPKRLWARILYKNAVKRSDVIYTVSKFSKSEILKFFKVSPEKIKVVYCGIQDNFESNINNKTIPLPVDYILFVGNVKPHKNLITLLKAYYQLDKTTTKKYKLVILGRKEGFVTEDSEVFTYVEDNNLYENVHFTGHVPDNVLSNVYRNATLFVFPSLYEGFGLPVLEAMSCGVAVLCSDRASIPEIAGNASIYFNPENIEELTDKIMRLLEDKDLRAEYVKKGLEQHKKFTWKNSIEKHKRYLKTGNE